MIIKLYVSSLWRRGIKWILWVNLINV
jgi:hypothetical protein